MIITREMFQVFKNLETVKYKLEDYVIGIIDVLKNNTSWNSYNRIMNGNTLRKKHYEWIKVGVYDHVYKKSLNKLLVRIPFTMLRIVKWNLTT